MKTDPANSPRSFCPLERRWRESPESAPLPRALRALKSQAPWIGDIVGMLCIIVATYGILLLAWVFE